MVDSLFDIYIAETWWPNQESACLQNALTLNFLWARESTIDMSSWITLAKSLCTLLTLTTVPSTTMIMGPANLCFVNKLPCHQTVRLGKIAANCNWIHLMHCLKLLWSSSEVHNAGKHVTVWWSCEWGLKTTHHLPQFQHLQQTLT